MSDCCRNPHGVHWTDAAQGRLVHGAAVTFDWAGKAYTAEVWGTLVEGDYHVLRCKALPGTCWLRFEPCGAAHVVYNAGAWGFAGALARLSIEAPALQGVLPLEVPGT